MHAGASAEDLAAVEAAIYEESFRVLDEQAKVVDGLRTRAASLVGAVNVATAFVGGLALSRETSVAGAAAWTAIGLYVLTILLAVWTYVPSRSWSFGHEPRDLLATYLDPGPPISLSAFRRTIVYYNALGYEVNSRRSNRLFRALAVASFCFVIELTLWLWILAS